MYILLSVHFTFDCSVKHLSSFCNKIKACSLTTFSCRGVRVWYQSINRILAFPPPNQCYFISLEKDHLLYLGQDFLAWKTDSHPFTDCHSKWLLMITQRHKAISETHWDSDTNWTSAKKRTNKTKTAYIYFCF